MTPKRAASIARYNRSPKHRACQKKYESSPKGRATWQRYEAKPDAKMLKHFRDENRRLYNRLRGQETR